MIPEETIDVIAKCLELVRLGAPRLIPWAFCTRFQELFCDSNLDIPRNMIKNNNFYSLANNVNRCNLLV